MTANARTAAIGLALIAALAGAPIFAVNPAPLKPIERMGIEAFAEIKAKTPIVTGPVHHYVQCVTRAVLLALPDKDRQGWEVVTFGKNQRNAFAVPGKKIGVYTGILDIMRTQNELAAVIGHEIAHVLAEHSQQRMTSEQAVQFGLTIVQLTMARSNPAQQRTIMGLLGFGADVGILLPYSRGHESEADHIGLTLMAKAGFDPRASIALWRAMNEGNAKNPPEFLSTHPANRTRIRQLERRMPEALKHYVEAITQRRAPTCD